MNIFSFQRIVNASKQKLMKLSAQHHKQPGIQDNGKPYQV